MRYQPRNPDTSKANRHTLYLATTGGGKSQALKQNPAIPRHGARVILWDQSGDHAGLHFQSRKGFLSGLRAGLHEYANRGRGFRVAYSGEASIDNFEWFIEVCWSVLDGRHDTYVIAEELSAVCAGTGKATPNAAYFMNQARKYGGIFHGTSQKPQEVSKTYYDQCRFRFIGQQRGIAMAKKMSAEMGIAPDEVLALKPLEFYRDDGTAERPELIRLKFKPNTENSVIWHP